MPPSEGSDRCCVVSSPGRAPQLSGPVACRLAAPALGPSSDRRLTPARRSAYLTLARPEARVVDEEAQQRRRELLLLGRPGPSPGRRCRHPGPAPASGASLCPPRDSCPEETALPPRSPSPRKWSPPARKKNPQPSVPFWRAPERVRSRLFLWQV